MPEVQFELIHSEDGIPQLFKVIVKHLGILVSSELLAKNNGDNIEFLKKCKDIVDSFDKKDFLKQAMYGEQVPLLFDLLDKNVKFKVLN